MLHGGDKFVESCIIDEACKQAIRDCIPLGPLHNPANLMGIEACEKAMPGKPQVAVFDTAFHMTMPPKAYRYAIPDQVLHREIICAATASTAPPTAIVSKRCHRADGQAPRTRSRRSSSATSATARPSPRLKDGKCQDTSMGLSPLAGVPDGHPRGRYRHLRRAVHHEQVQHVRRRVPDHAQQEVRRAGPVRRRVLRLP
ncbi:MAG: hypothetical protein ACLU3F_15160 [Blautia wexlerae]